MDLYTCRICLNRNGSVYLFDKEDDISYSVKIMQCVGMVTISEGDGLPTFICEDCSSQLKTAYNFNIKCQESDKRLRLLCDLKQEATPSDFECLDFYSEQLDIDINADFLETKESLKREPDDNQTANEILNVEFYDNEITSKVEDKKNGLKRSKKGKSGPIQCTICGLMVTSASAMKIHMRTHTGEKPYKCQYCTDKFPSNGALKRHIDTYHTKRERKFTCETCGSSFYRKNDIITHIRRHTGEKPYACPYCSKRFLQITSLIRHKRIHTNDKPYPCPICGKRFNDKSLVTKHQSVHSNEKKFMCHLCFKALKTKSSLTTHLSLHSNEKRQTCSLCNMQFAMKGNLKTHMMRVHSERSGECSLCMKTFSDLEAHMRKHTGEKPFVCDICQKCFGCKRSLANHVLFKHENSSKYKCSIGECTKTFPTSTMLEFHLLKHHTNHTPYICQHCSRGFFRTSDLSRHIRVNHTDAQLKLPLKTLPT